jgi:hypothetical protein
VTASGSAGSDSRPSFGVEMIAPCGMDCELCMAHMRQRKPCAGCNGDDATKPMHCVVCAIKHCEQPRSGETGLCFECERFPCRRIRDLDKRYRTKYGMSMIENLESIRDGDLAAFLAQEPRRWTCPECGSILCVHMVECPGCGTAWH